MCDNALICQESDELFSNCTFEICFDEFTTKYPRKYSVSVYDKTTTQLFHKDFTSRQIIDFVKKGYISVTPEQLCILERTMV